jgi:hypothetical protein
MTEKNDGQETARADDEELKEALSRLLERKRRSDQAADRAIRQSTTVEKRLRTIMER